MPNGLVVIQDLGEWVYCLDTNHIIFLYGFFVLTYTV